MSASQSNSWDKPWSTNPGEESAWHGDTLHDLHKKVDRLTSLVETLMGAVQTMSNKLDSCELVELPQPPVALQTQCPCVHTTTSKASVPIPEDWASFFHEGMEAMSVDAIYSLWASLEAKEYLLKTSLGQTGKQVTKRVVEEDWGVLQEGSKGYKIHMYHRPCGLYWQVCSSGEKGKASEEDRKEFLDILFMP